MAEVVATRRSALAAHTKRNAALIPLPPASRFIFRGREAAIAAAGTAFGVALPRDACRAASAGERAALWLGPDEWLLIGPDVDAPAVADAIERATQDLPHALVDIGHRQVAVSVTGNGAALVLSAGCPLDLDEASVPVGMCTRTVLAKAEIVLWRIGADSFRIEVSRTFAAYLWQFLEQARRDWTA
jgi:sarcosine oxidase subunit gamma